VNTPPLGLVGDVGATNARFALVRRDGTLTDARNYIVSEYPTLLEAIEAFLSREAMRWPTRAALAVASPISGDTVTLTNHPWSFSREALRQSLKLERLRVVNDFAANAISIPCLSANDLQPVGGGDPAPSAPIGVIGPGSGLGVSGLIPAPSGWTALQSEGGHVTMAPVDDRESRVLEILRKRYGHVSAERVLSGPGLSNLYDALRSLSGTATSSRPSAWISDPNTWDEDSVAREATAMFCAMLGSVAGNLALTLGAQGGIYIAGGIVPKLGAFFAASDFRERFESKGRFRDYLAQIPTYVITHPAPALLGAATLLK
jgi:glucokinase